MRHLCFKIKEQTGRHKTVASQGKRLAACCTDVPLIQALWRTNTPPHLLQSYLICLRGSNASHLSKAAFLLPTLEVALVGRKENESVWGCGVRWYSCSSEVCLVGPELYWLERKLTAEFWGPENLDERKLLKLMPTSALERRAAIQPSLPAYTTQTATHTHRKHAFISKHTNTDSGHHAYMYFLKSSTHSHREHILASFLTSGPRDEFWLVVGDSGRASRATSRTKRAWSGWKNRTTGWKAERPWGNKRTGHNTDTGKKKPDDSLIIINMMCNVHYTDYLLIINDISSFNP